MTFPKCSAPVCSCIDLGASETLFSTIWGVIFELKDRNKLIFDFIERCYVEPFNATHPGHAALPGHAVPFWACCFPWACCYPRGMLVNSGHAAPPPGHAGQFWACCYPGACLSILGMLLPRGMLVASGHPAAPWACSSPCRKASS